MRYAQFHENYKTAYWEIVPGNLCNLKCKNCYAAENARPDSRLLNWKKLKIALDRAIEFGIKKIDILGGEPLLHPHIDRKSVV